MAKIHIIQKKLTFQTTKSFIVATMLAVFGAALLVPVVASADNFDVQIQELNKENEQKSQVQAGLEVEEVSIESKTASLQANVAETEASIRNNQAKGEQLSKDIIASEAEVVKQRGILGTNIRRLYLENQMSMGEMLVTSNSLGEYMDKQEYRIAVQDKVKATKDRIEALQQEQQAQKATVDKLVVDQQAMRMRLAFQKEESDRLLGLNQSQQQVQQQEIAGNTKEIAELQRLQAIENAKYFVEPIRKTSTPPPSKRTPAKRQMQTAKQQPKPTSAAAAPQPAAAAAIQYVSGDAYPWKNVPFPNSLVDPWGMYKRQCVSYTAWKVASSGRHMPYWGGRGNAKQWDDNARAAGIPVDGNPRVGDIAVSNAGTYGHVMYVESVHGDGTITISDYNGAWDGNYREGRRTAAGLVFIHF